MYRDLRRRGPFDGTLNYVSANRSLYLGLVGGTTLLIVALVILAAALEWWGIVPLALAALLLLAYFTLASLWSAYQQYDYIEPDALFVSLGKIQPTENCVSLTLGERLIPYRMIRHLTTGRLNVIDIYAPQVMPAPKVLRFRRLAARLNPRQDPRISWLDGSLDLLPLADSSATAVVMNRVLVHIAQHGDRVKLLAEINRILKPGGRLVIAERVRTQINWLVLGPFAANLPPLPYWRDILEQNGFQVREEFDVSGVVRYFSAIKPMPTVGQQLPLIKY